MAMPNDLVLIRHGQSEANIVQKLRKKNPDAPLPHGFYDRHDSEMRLSTLGQEQAIATGEWLRTHDLATFDRCFVSPHTRTQETAALLKLGTNWYVDDLWRERDWGEYGVLSTAEREKIHRTSTKLRDQNPWYWCPAGGESLSTGVRSRLNEILHTLHRTSEGQRVLAVTHGEMIAVARFVLERMTPDKWLENERNPRRIMRNCMIVHFSRRDPDTGDIAPHLMWMRGICPWKPSWSWVGGRWLPIERRLLSDDDLMANVQAYPPYGIDPALLSTGSGGGAG